MLEMKPLPYPLDALEPYYSKETLDLHYRVLYKGYVGNTNKTQQKLIIARETNDYENIKCLSKNLSFFGSGVILHELFFYNMGITGQQMPSEKLMTQIKKDFINYQTFQKQFAEAATNVEASGWCILVWESRFRKLEILQCEKHQNLTLWGCIPLFVLDMWEHSYYLQYQTKRAEYIQNFWKIVNWKEVDKRFENIVLN